MVDPISSSQLASIASNNGVAQPADPSSLGGVNPQDAENFANAMQQPNQVGQVGEVNGTEQSGFMNKIDQMSTDMRTQQEGLFNSANAIEGSMGDLLKTQFQVAQLTMSQTMVGQVGSKTSQGTQQLLKGQ